MATKSSVTRPRIGWALLIGILIGLGGTIMFLRAATPPQTYVFPSVPRYTYTHRGEPDARQLTAGDALLQVGTQALVAYDFSEADIYFGQCIELSNLPECHRRLATLLLMIRNNSAGAHYEQATRER